MKEYKIFVDGRENSTITADNYTHALEKALSYNNIIIEEVQE